MTQRMDYAAAAPAGVKALGQLYGHVLQAGLDPRLLDLIYLRVSQVNGCAYCIDMHTRDLLKRGVGIEMLALIPVWREAGALFTPTERAALAWAETVTRVADTAIPDVEYAAAAAAFDPTSLAELTIAIGLINTYNRLAVAFRATPQAVRRAVAAAA
ncbi:carboxymuconolactone decarboxylase family protein [Roseomonas nepalensis]|uniref:Carboxymuconolactone decarboxylase family protein n=1 Tax=Muricoccus nepalensis TaxID=1854500 RepID=A0A502F9E4_9PROT|nr:carboxymuconolactone decarboxylase family protein [Roseomonas nepalensis]TPG46022.1 carboxymuconolactone decarboxylase family protein [Roseomonas nepalensis]